MIDSLINALNRTINNAGGPHILTGTLIQEDNEPIWYVSFLTNNGGTVLLELIWRDGGIVTSVLNKFKISDNQITKITNHFLKWVDVSEMPPLYDFED